jgi:hypothetical protein
MLLKDTSEFLLKVDVLLKAGWKRDLMSAAIDTQLFEVIIAPGAPLVSIFSDPCKQVVKDYGEDWCGIDIGL